MGGIRRTPAALAVLLLAGCAAAGQDSGQQGAQEQGYVAQVRGGVLEYATGERADAPALSGETPAGEPLDAATYAGDVVVYNVWASWCGPCVREAPVLERVASDLRSEGVAFLGINIQDSPAAAMAFERQHNVSYPSLADPKGELVLAFKGRIPTGPPPSTVVVDRQGGIAAVVPGEVEESVLRALVTDVLAEPAPAGGGTT